MTQRYDTYKDSGVQWLGEIPGHWGCVQNRFIFKENVRFPQENDTPLSLSQVDGLIPTDDMKESSLKTSSYDNWKRVHIDDIVLNRFKAHLGVLFASKYIGMVSFHYGVFEMIRPIIPKYYEYMFHSDQFRLILGFASKGMTVGLQNLGNADFYNLKSLYPPIEEQHSIVSYLDDKCGKIDKMLEGKQKQIELLAEMKQRIIADAVTHGLNPDVKMKATNIPWLPEIPEHWEMDSLRRFLKIFAEKGHGDKQLLSVTREQGVIVRNTDSKEDNHNFIPEDLSGYKYVHAGDFVINKMKSWQGSYGVSEYEGIVSPAYFTCKLQGVNKDFFSTAIRSKIYVSFFARYSKGIRVDQWDLSPVALKSIPFALPPLPEQRAIVSYITGKTSKIDTLTSKLQQEIESIKEYKQRLISDVVTGQIKVC